MADIKKSEIHALQYAVCMFVNILDQVLCRRLKGWEPNVRGFNLEVSERRSPSDLNVDIFPVGWPEGSYINARFDGDNKNGWDFWEGCITANHLQLESGNSFNVFFQMRVTRTWSHPGLSCFSNEGETFFKQAAREAGFTVQD